ncbi:MAG: hypothetical protein K0R84_339 [Clostridia bacterium]|jgi:amino acid transporter|nr:hypothetical protein [Clostridia bacterium]
MKFAREFGFQCFVFVVLICLLLVGWDLSRPIINTETAIRAEDVVECIVYPFTNTEDDNSGEFDEISAPEFHFFTNIVIPITIYILCAGGMIYLLIENLRLLKVCSYQSAPGRFLWIVWLIVLGAAVLLPVIFGAQLIMKGVILAVIATVIFLLILGIITRLSHLK